MSDSATSSTPAAAPQGDPATPPIRQPPTGTAPNPTAPPAPAQGEDAAATITRLEPNSPPPAPRPE